METRTIDITGMSCGHCVAAVKKALGEIDGVDVRAVEVGKATVAFDSTKVDDARVTRAIEEQGFSVAAGGR